MISQDTIEKMLRIIEKGYSQYEYFFDNISSSVWIGPLTQYGFFKRPPAISCTADGNYWPRWPESRYLMRIAGDSPEAVSSAFIAMEATENPWVHADIIDAALKMPGPYAAELAEVERKWIDASDEINIFVDDNLGKLVIHLAQSGEKNSSLALAKSVFDILPDKRQNEDAKGEPYPAGMEFFGLPQPRTKLNQSFGLILSDTIPILIEHTGLEALILLADLLSKAISFSHVNSSEEKPYDYSNIWFPAIDCSEKYATSMIKHPLALMLRNGALQYVDNNPNPIEDFVFTIESRQWDIFYRITLYVLSKNFQVCHGLVRNHLLDKHLFSEGAFANEYYLLASVAFPILNTTDQNTILSWIDEGPQHIREDKFGYDEQEEPYVKTWKCQRLHQIREHLVGKARAQYETVLNEVGGMGTENFADCRRIRSWIGPTSPLSSEEIMAMSDDEIIAFLSEWEAPGGWASPTPEGLSRSLTAAVEANPSQFLSLLSQLSDYEPTYVRGILEGFEQAIRQGKEFDCEPVLKLSEWVIQEHGGEPDQEIRGGDRDPGWGWTRKTIASFLYQCFHRDTSPIPFQFRDRIWNILAILCEDPDPSVEYEDDSKLDATNRSLNVTRGKAFHALIGYMLWVRHNLAKDSNYDSKESGWILEMPEAREIMECHLSPSVDPSTAIRSVYGHWFRELMWLDSEWAQSITQSIFGGPTTKDNLQDIAWNTYIVFCQPDSDVFRVLEDIYAMAVANLHSGQEEKENYYKPERQLAEHLIALYTWGYCNTDRRMQILNTFFENAWPLLRANAISCAGQLVERAHDTTVQGMVVRLSKLWEQRLTIARTAPDISEYYEELSEFGWWYASGRFEEGWALAQLIEVLEITGKIKPDLDVLRRLVSISEERLSKALECLESLEKGDKQGWAILGWEKEVSAILKRCLESSHEGLPEKTRQFVHLLGAKGFRSYRHLLAENN